MAKKGGRSKKTEEKGARGVNPDENKLRIDGWEDVADDVDRCKSITLWGVGGC